MSASYASSWQNTMRGNWGYAAKSTAEFTHGSSRLFDRDAFGAEIMRDRCPAPANEAEQNALFDDAAAMLRSAIEAAHRLGIEVCIGTETPLAIPRALQDRLRSSGKDPFDPTTAGEIYEAIFERIALACPVDWYWLWTPERWTWSGADEAQVQRTLADIRAARAALDRAGRPFRLATCGWVLGPPSDRALFGKALPEDVVVSCINRSVGMAPVEPSFAAVAGRGKWAIPWLEDDPALTQPQLWAGRMRADAAAARAYGCDGLLGIHWRTRVLSMNVQALAEAAWDQDWPPAEEVPTPFAEGVEGGHCASFPDHPIADTDDDDIYRDVRYDVLAYRFAVPDGRYRVVLKFCEPYYSQAGKRVFGVEVQGKKAIDRLDLFATVGKDRAFDVALDGVVVQGGVLTISFDKIVEFPSIAAIEIAGGALDESRVLRRVNCGGPAVGDWAADFADSVAPPRGLPAADFYDDWARAEFGPNAGPAAAAIFSRLDGRLPRPADWTGGPGGIKPDARPWREVEALYAFADEFAALQDRVEGAAERERFEYWRHTLCYLRAMAKVACASGAFDRVMAKVKATADPQARAALAMGEALPARVELISAVDEAYEHLLVVVGNPGELGTLANWEQHLLPKLVDRPGEELALAMGSPLPAAARLSHSYGGPPRVIVPTVRTMAAAGEALSLRVLVLAKEPPAEAFACVRRLGAAREERRMLRHVARGVYTVDLPAMDGSAPGFEYWIGAKWSDGRAAVFPPTAPRVGQTVVVAPLVAR
ncbi:MAG: hypothetical protein Fur0037_03090 [Planctomycetota bacterium]